MCTIQIGGGRHSGEDWEGLLNSRGGGGLELGGNPKGWMLGSKDGFCAKGQEEVGELGGILRGPD